MVSQLYCYNKGRRRQLRAPFIIICLSVQKEIMDGIYTYIYRLESSCQKSLTKIEEKMKKLFALMGLLLTASKLELFSFVINVRV